MSGLRIYLSGPISITDYSGATAWYEDAREMLDESFELLRPMRGKEYLAGRPGPIEHYPANDARNPFPHRLGQQIATGQAITARDRADTMRADLVLMNLLGCNGRISIGCMIEAGWADAARVPIILVAERGNPHEGHAMLETLAAYRVHTLADACDLANSYLPGRGWGSNDRPQSKGEAYFCGPALHLSAQRDI